MYTMNYCAVANLCFWWWLVCYYQVDSECNKVEQWLRGVSQLQESLPKNVDPVVWSYQIKEQEQELDMYVSFLPKAA
jgi:hypothetical protein